MATGRFQRKTRQREVILKELRRLRSHPTAVGLYEIVRRRLPRISLGTVYRNLERLADMGVIQKLVWAGSQARFDGNADCHHHVRCTRCGRVDDLPGPPLDLAKVKYDDCHGYQLFGYRLEYLGICPRCRQESRESSLSRD
jgi:Fur family ferric uptake transcriptional regulator